MKKTGLIFIFLSFSIFASGFTLSERLAMKTSISPLILKEQKKPTRSFANFDPNLVKKRKAKHKSQIERIKNMFSDRGIDIDTDGDGKADFFRTYDKGRLAKIESYTKNFKHPSYVANYRKGEILSSELYDFNSDGKVERKKSCNEKRVCEYLSDTNSDGKFDRRRLEKLNGNLLTRANYVRVKDKWKKVSTKKMAVSFSDSVHSSSEGTASSCDGDCMSQLPKVDLSDFREVADSFKNTYKVDKFVFNTKDIFNMNEYGLIVHDNCYETYGRDGFNDIIETAINGMMSCAQQASKQYPSIEAGVVQNVRTAVLSSLSVTKIKKRPKITCPKPKAYQAGYLGRAVISGYDETRPHFRDLGIYPKPVIGIFPSPKGEKNRTPKSVAVTMFHELLHTSVLGGHAHDDTVDIVDGCSAMLRACLDGEAVTSAKFKAAARICSNNGSDVINLDMTYTGLNGEVLEGYDAVLASIKDHQELKGFDFSLTSFGGALNVVKFLPEKQKKEILSVILPRSANNPVGSRFLRRGPLSELSEEERQKYPDLETNSLLSEEILRYLRTGVDDFSDDLARYLALSFNHESNKADRLLQEIKAKAYNDPNNLTLENYRLARDKRNRWFAHNINFFKPIIEMGGLSSQAE